MTIRIYTKDMELAIVHARPDQNHVIFLGLYISYYVDLSIIRQLALHSSCWPCYGHYRCEFIISSQSTAYFVTLLYWYLELQKYWVWLSHYSSFHCNVKSLANWVPYSFSDLSRNTYISRNCILHIIGIPVSKC